MLPAIILLRRDAADCALRLLRRYAITPLLLITLDAMMPLLPLSPLRHMLPHATRHAVTPPLPLRLR